MNQRKSKADHGDLKRCKRNNSTALFAQSFRHLDSNILLLIKDVVGHLNGRLGQLGHVKAFFSFRRGRSAGKSPSSGLESSAVVSVPSVYWRS